jgi:hypothetical protein
MATPLPEDWPPEGGQGPSRGVESLSKRNGRSMLDCETYKSIRYNPFIKGSR